MQNLTAAVAQQIGHFRKNLNLVRTWRSAYRSAERHYNRYIRCMCEVVPDGPLLLGSNNKKKN